MKEKVFNLFLFVMGDIIRQGGWRMCREVRGWSD
jgi:hypothetical protein